MVAVKVKSGTRRFKILCGEGCLDSADSGGEDLEGGDGRRGEEVDIARGRGEEGVSVEL